ncbi:hypothetical protein HKX48_002020, partial [Thoreauomyces humboldtii]
IENKPRGARRNGGGGGGAGGSGGAARNGRRGGDSRARPYASAAPPAALSSKIVVSNLATGVTENDVLELFSQIGPVRSAQLNYDASGRSKGVATVLFRDPTNASKAIREYHNRSLDNKPMRIELVVRADAAGSAAAHTAPRHQGGGDRGGDRERAGGDRSGGGRRAGGGRAPRGGRGDSTHKRTPKSQDQLDAEMEAYMKSDTMELDAAPAVPTDGVNASLTNALAL